MISKLKSKEQEAQKQKRNNILLGTALVALMILSTAGYSFMNNDQSDPTQKKDAGLSFLYQNGRWSTIINGVSQTFTYLPSDVKNVTIKGEYSLNQYAGRPLYLTTLDEGTIELLGFLGPYALRYQQTCLENSTCETDLPIKNCNDNIIISTTTGETTVTKDKECIYLSGETVKAADALIYHLLGIKT